MVGACRASLPFHVRLNFIHGTQHRGSPYKRFNNQSQWIEKVERKSRFRYELTLQQCATILRLECEFMLGWKWITRIFTSETESRRRLILGYANLIRNLLAKGIISNGSKLTAHAHHTG